MQQTFSKLLAQKHVTAADLLVELHNLKLESLAALGEHRMRLHKVCLAVCWQWFSQCAGDGGNIVLLCFKGSFHFRGWTSTHFTDD